jgi:ATP-binding cassette subfamily B (MDR/TAP) protein 8
VHASFKLTALSLLSLHSERLCARIKTLLFEKILQMDIAYFDNVRTGELIDRLSGDVNDIRTMVKHTVSLGLKNVLSVVGGVVSLLAISRQLTGVMFLAVPVVIGTGTLYGSFLRNLSKDVRDRQAKALATAQEAINNIRTVRAFASEEVCSPLSPLSGLQNWSMICANVLWSMVYVPPRTLCPYYALMHTIGRDPTVR